MGSYVATTKQEREEMLKLIGCTSINELFNHIPEEVKIKNGLNIPNGMSEMEVRKKMEKISAKNKVFPTIFRGAGVYRHFIPAIVKSVISKENFMTAYTPYQAEISQGILQSIFEYQTMICQLTGMDVSNACVYDGAEAAAEATTMCKDRKRNSVFISETSNPYVIETVKTYCFGSGMDLNFIPEKNGRTDLEYLKANITESTACVMIQQPNFYGNIEFAKEIGEISHAVGAKYVMSVDPISLGIMETPKEAGADVAVGEGQSLGLPMGFGGPYLGFMACTSDMTRKLPGRIVGETEDGDGKKGYVLTLQAREQHIRREKASSNICSNEALCALAISVYMSSMGRKGIEEAASLSISKAHYLAEKLDKIGYSLVNTGEYFNEFVTKSKVSVLKIMENLEAKGILGGYPLSGTHKGEILWCCTEVNTKEEMDIVIKILEEAQKC